MAIKDEFVYSFIGFGGVQSRCHIRILDDQDKPIVVVCSQMATKSGTSVTNAAEIIAQNVVREFLERDNVTHLERTDKSLVWVEHYAAGLGLGSRESYAIVTFHQDSGTPNWDHVSLATVASRTGYPPADFNVPIDVLA